MTNLHQGFEHFELNDACIEKKKNLTHQKHQKCDQIIQIFFKTGISHLHVRILNNLN